MLLPEADLQNIVTLAPAECRWLYGKRVFLTGGTGFIGMWFLALFSYLNRAFGAGIYCSVPSRDPKVFLSAHPEFCAPEFEVFLGDVRSFAFPVGSFDLVIHAATDVGHSERAKDYSTIFDVCVGGTRRVLDFVEKKDIKRVLLLSSGAVYGRQDPDQFALSETAGSMIDPTASASAYGEGKRVSEWLVANESRIRGFHAAIARCFAFTGPGLPLSGPFAVGNFLADAMGGRPIVIKGDGTALRSYLYVSDLIVWLLVLLFRGKSAEAYNIGSDIPISIRDLAEAVSMLTAQSCRVDILGTPVSGRLAERYIPSVEKAKAEFGVTITVPFEEGLKRHWKWLREDSVGFS